MRIFEQKSYIGVERVFDEAAEIKFVEIGFFLCRFEIFRTKMINF